VLALAHFALRDNGLLMLGSAESPGAAPGLFEPVDEKLRIYRRSGRERSARVRFSMLDLGHTSDTSRPVVRPAAPKSTSLQDLVQRMMLETYAPAAVVTNRQLVPLFYFGAADRYLKIAAGEPNQDLLSIAREGLRPKLRETVARAFRANRRASAHGVRFEREGKAASVTIEAQRMADENESLVLVVFVDETPASGGARAAAVKGEDSAALVLLRQQLTETRRELNRTIHELRETNEELKAKNEEAMSLNEEFLSTNEELESSKEELQSLNEELTTVNNQLRQTLDQQQQTSTDLENLLNSAAVATIMLDAELRIKIFNPRMKALFSLIDADIGRPLADLVPKFSDPQLPSDATLARSTGTPSQREIRAESGAWYVRSVLPYRTETGDIRGAVVTFADVSRLKQAELESVAARQYAETVVNAIREPLAVLDADVRIVSANAAFCTAFDLASDAVAGRTLHELGRPVLADARLIELATRIRAQPKGVDQIELEAEQPDGGRRIWRAHARSFLMSPAEPALILLSLDDVTDERRIVRRQLQLLIDALPGAFLGIDKQSVIRFVSDQIESLFGYRREELLGQTFDMLLPPEMRARHVPLHAGYLDNPTVRPMASGLDITGLTKDGRRISLDVGLSPMVTADGFLVIAVIHDLQTMKQGETQLREARVAADRANQAKSRFLAAASHDLRQPLQAIGLLHGVLERQAANPAASATIAKLDDAVGYMGELLDTLLDINQIESGAITPELAELPVGPLLARAADEFAPQAAAKGLDLRVVGTSGVIHSDRQLLARMLGNLLSNAIKYTDHGRVLVGCRRRGKTLRIEVWDTGAGIPAENLKTIFQEFYRIDRTDAGKFGLGLGLYIVARFAELLGYEIETRSTPGKGTMFALVIPGAAFAAATPGSLDIAQAASTAPTVLLVEDDPAQLETLRLLLEIEGYKVVAARKSDEALALLRGSTAVRPDIIVTDYNLPGGTTGLAMIRQVRDRFDVRVPAVIVSGDKLAADLPEIKAAGVRFITKPTKAADVVAAVSALAKIAKPGWQGGRKPAAPAAAPSGSTSGAEIAVIDDEPGVRDAIQMMLEAEGHQVATFASGQAFLSDANRGRFRCLVADLSLPGMDGLELQSRLKPELPDLPIIFVTGRGSLPIAVKAMREGAADFLEKPVHSAQLRESVARALAHGAQDEDHRLERENVAVRLATLTEREREVMERIVKGQLNKNIASDLGISQRTAEHHRHSVMHKMDAKSLAMLVQMVGVTVRGE